MQMLFLQIREGSQPSAASQRKPVQPKVQSLCSGTNGLRGRVVRLVMAGGAGRYLVHLKLLREVDARFMTSLRDPMAALSSRRRETAVDVPSAPVETCEYSCTNGQYVCTGILKRERNPWNAAIVQCVSLVPDRSMLVSETSLRMHIRHLFHKQQFLLRQCTSRERIAWDKHLRPGRSGGGVVFSGIVPMDANNVNSFTIERRVWIILIPVE
jgi:hypothetical protein